MSLMEAGSQRRASRSLPARDSLEIDVARARLDRRHGSPSPLARAGRLLFGTRRARVPRCPCRCAERGARRPPAICLARGPAVSIWIRAVRSQPSVDAGSVARSRLSIDHGDVTLLDALVSRIQRTRHTEIKLSSPPQCVWLTFRWRPSQSVTKSSSSPPLPPRPRPFSSTRRQRLYTRLESMPTR